MKLTATREDPSASPESVLAKATLAARAAYSHLVHIFEADESSSALESQRHADDHAPTGEGERADALAAGPWIRARCAVSSHSSAWARLPHCV